MRVEAPTLATMIALLSWCTENLDHPADRVRQMARRWFNQSQTRYEIFLTRKFRLQNTMSIPLWRKNAILASLNKIKFIFLSI